MARDIGRRLARLRDRRFGTDRLARLNETARNEVLAKSYVEEEGTSRKNRVHERETQVLGGLKKSIRLCKNVKTMRLKRGESLRFRVSILQALCTGRCLSRGCPDDPA